MKGFMVISYLQILSVSISKWNFTLNFLVVFTHNLHFVVKKSLSIYTQDVMISMLVSRKKLTSLEEERRANETKWWLLVKALIFLVEAM